MKAEWSFGKIPRLLLLQASYDQHGHQKSICSNALTPRNPAHPRQNCTTKQTPIPTNLQHTHDMAKSKRSKAASIREANKRQEMGNKRDTTATQGAEHQGDSIQPITTQAAQLRRSPRTHSNKPEARNSEPTSKARGNDDMSGPPSPMGNTEPSNEVPEHFVVDAVAESSHEERERVLNQKRRSRETNQQGTGMTVHVSRAKRARFSTTNSKNDIELVSHSANGEDISEYHGKGFVTDDAAQLRAQLLDHLHDPAQDLQSTNSTNSLTTGDSVIQIEQALLEQRRKDRSARENLPKELLMKVLRLAVDHLVPDRLCIAEEPVGGSRGGQLHGLNRVPKLIYADRWFLETAGGVIFADFYPTIDVDTSAPYPQWREWMTAWLPVERTFSRMLISFNGFDAPTVYALAEIAYFFSLSDTISRIDRNPIVLARDRQNVLNKGTLPDGKRDDRPAEHILAHVGGGYPGDNERTMLMLITKVADIGRQFRGGTVSREGFRMKVFDWLMGPIDFTPEQTMGRRGINTTKFPVLQTTYDQWNRRQPKSSHMTHSFGGIVRGTVECWAQTKS
jgi:hypothetical protein